MCVTPTVGWWWWGVRGVNRQISNKERVKYSTLQEGTHQQIQEDPDVASTSVPFFENEQFRKFSGFRLVGEEKRQIQYSLYSPAKKLPATAQTFFTKKGRRLASSEI